MSASGGLQSREQRIVACFQDALPREEQQLKGLRARTLDLPAMLRRHGLMHVLLFLIGKEGSDRQLAGLLHRGIAAALGPSGPTTLEGGIVQYAEGLAGVELPLYLLHWEAAQEAATWLKLLVEARTQSAGAAAREALPDESGQ